MIRPTQALEGSWRRILFQDDRLIAAVGMLAIYGILLSRFDLKLLFTDTILTGGDSASWLQPLEHLAKDYLPRLRLFGYSHSNFFGYLEGQHYFVLPFLVPALLGAFMPLTVALKLATFAGCAALPATMYAAARSITGSRKGALLASAGSLLFLFNESYTMFGGNFLSTFAGEFCYSWAIAFFPLFIAAVWKDYREGRSGLISGLLLGLIGLCHLFVFMVAFFLPFFFLFAPGEPWLRRSSWSRNLKKGHISRKHKDGSSSSRSNIEDPPTVEVPGTPGCAGAAHLPGRLVTTVIMALLVMAFWFVPMATTRTWAQSISMVWYFSSFLDFAKQTLMPVWVAAVLALAPAALLLRGKDRQRALYLLYGLLACAIMFVVSRFLEIPDIRFVPPALILSVLAFASLGTVIGGRIRFLAVPWRKIAATAACLLASGILIIVAARNAPAWFRWNYTGYEAKQGWADLKALSDFARGDIMSGRILWEKQNQRDNADFGSERGFENLYMLTGRPSAEGIHYGSSNMARAITYLQSEYSPEPVDPEAWRLYSKVNPDVWPTRFAQSNARYIITHSADITALFEKHPDFELAFRSGKFSLFSYRGFPGSYIEQREAEDILVLQDSPGGFKTDFYRFYRDYECLWHPFVPASFLKKGQSLPGTAPAYAAASGSPGSAGGGYLKDYESLKRLVRDEEVKIRSWQSYAPSLDPKFTGPGSRLRASITEEKLDSFSVSFRTNAPGKPHIVKISYAPGWKSTTGEPIYPVAPGFMLIYPRTDHVELRYGRSAAEVAGLILSALTPFWALAVLRFRKRSMKHWRPFVRTVAVLYVIIVGSLVGIATFGVSKMLADVQKARFLDLGRPGAPKTALALVEPYTRMRMLELQDTMLTFEAYRVKAAALIREGRTEEARSIILMLRERYPHARALDWLPQI